MLFISCIKTHQSQGQVTFLKTVPLFLQGYTYYLKRVMTPMLVPASNFFSLYLLAFELLPHEPHCFTSVVPSENRMGRSATMTSPWFQTESTTTAKPNEYAHISKQNFPQTILPPPPGIFKSSCVISDMSIYLVGETHLEFRTCLIMDLAIQGMVLLCLSAALQGWQWYTHTSLFVFEVSGL